MTGSPSRPLDDIVRRLLLFGTDEPLPERVPLGAGALTAGLVSGGLVEVCWGGIEVLQGVQLVCRSTGWATPAPLIREVRTEVEADRFEVRLEAQFVLDTGLLDWRMTIRGDGSGRLELTAEGVSPSGLQVNRLGFVVLHPLAGVVGRPAEVRTGAGSLHQSRFPEHVDPNPIFTEMTGLRYRMQGGPELAIHLEGDLFETEDHRNWLDASYKTYSRPLSRGFPYTIPAGAPFRQRVELTICGAEAVSPVPAAGGPPQLRAAGIVPRWPEIGLFLRHDDLAATDRAREAGKLPSADVVTVRASADTEGWERSFLDRLAIARNITPAIRVEVVAPDVEQAATTLHTVAGICGREGVRPAAVLAATRRDLRSIPPGTDIDRLPDPAVMAAAARLAFPGVPIASGSPLGFAELNRRRPPADADLVTWSTWATVHAADDRSVMQTLEVLTWQVRSPEAMRPGIPVHIGAATIGMPENPSGGVPAANPERRRMPTASEDPRQQGLFAAAYAFAYAIEAAGAGVRSICLGAPVGPAGLVGETAEGIVERPIALAFAALRSIGKRGCRLLAPCHENGIRGVIEPGDRGDHYWLVNTTPSTLAVRLDAPIVAMARLDAARLGEGRALVEETWSGATGDISLDSYAICHVISGSRDS